MLLGLVPLLRRPVLAATESLGPRAGALLSAALLFAPSLVALGMIGPVITDDKNPLAHLQLAVAADHYHFMTALFGFRAVWTN